MQRMVLYVPVYRMPTFLHRVFLYLGKDTWTLLSAAPAAAMASREFQYMEDARVPGVALKGLKSSIPTTILK